MRGTRFRRKFWTQDNENGNGKLARGGQWGCFQESFE